MEKINIPTEFLETLQKIRNKRARWVIDFILEHGSITTEDIRNQGYNDPYRPTQDVRDEGIPLVTFKVKNKQGRWITAYRFDTVSNLRNERAGGRKNFSKNFKKKLVETYGEYCYICLSKVSNLQIDHRIPYQLSGESSGEPIVKDFMLLCGSCNRAKSWSCEHCENYTVTKNPEICQTCYWASPLSYEHVVLIRQRRTEIIWDEEEINLHSLLQEQADLLKQPLAVYIKKFIKNNWKEV